MMRNGLLMPVAALATLMMLAGCAKDAQGIDPGSLTVKNSAAAGAKPSASAACISLKPISPNRGKPGGPTLADIEAALDRDNPIGRVRNLVGDTGPTLRQVDEHNAALGALCSGGENGVGKGGH